MATRSENRFGKFGRAGRVRLGFEVNTDGVVARLDGLAAGIADAAEPLAEAGALLLMRFWDRIAGRPTTVYSRRYVAWLITVKQMSGKLLGVLSGRLIGSGAPGGTASLRTEPEVPGRSQLVGFLDPGQRSKARGFSRWYESKFGAPPFMLTDQDERDVRSIFEDWVVRHWGGRMAFG